MGMKTNCLIPVTSVSKLKTVQDFVQETKGRKNDFEIKYTTFPNKILAIVSHSAHENFEGVYVALSVE